MPGVRRLPSPERLKEMRTKKSLLHILVIALVLGLPGASFGRPVMPSLQALTRAANLIVVAQVKEVVTEPRDNRGDASGLREITWERRTATARVLDVWKGTGVERVQFRASKSWICDVSDAVVGETVILFLTSGESTSVTSIAYSGIGRLPVEHGSVLLSSSLLTREIKTLLRLPEETFRHRVEVGTLKGQVRQIAEVNSGAE
jgi:hypothetical protein